MTCKDCIHYNTCVIVEHRVDENEDHLSEFGCEDFINKNDVGEVVHGEWIKADSMPLSAKCSECNCWITRHTIKENWFRYCPHCGAKMNKKRKWNIEIIF